MTFRLRIQHWWRNSFWQSKTDSQIMNSISYKTLKRTDNCLVKSKCLFVHSVSHCSVTPILSRTCSVMTSILYTFMPLYVNTDSWNSRQTTCRTSNHEISFCVYSLSRNIKGFFYLNSYLTNTWYNTLWWDIYLGSIFYFSCCLTHFYLFYYVRIFIIIFLIFGTL